MADGLRVAEPSGAPLSRLDRLGRQGVGTDRLMRRMIAIAAGLTTLAVAVGCGTAAAITTTTEHDHGEGTVAGQAVFAKPGSHGVVRVFNAADRLVARRGVRSPRSHFRFVLKPGRYVVELKLRGRSRWAGCPHKKTVGVRASHTTHVTLGQGCVSTY
jgi:hypothetical protein